jgi:hypothetical protein
MFSFFNLSCLTGSCFFLCCFPQVNDHAVMNPDNYRETFQVSLATCPERTYFHNHGFVTCGFQHNKTTYLKSYCDRAIQIFFSQNIILGTQSSNPLFL